jgi:large subunit ribosomal protein L19
MSQQIIDAVQKSQLKSDLPELNIGDTVDVHCRIIEGAKERIQIFNGVIIGMTGSGLNRTVTVRRIVANEGVERIFPLHSPKIAKFEVVRHGGVRRAKLYYLRERVGKKRRLRDRRRGLDTATAAEPEKAPTAAPAEHAGTPAAAAKA